MRTKKKSGIGQMLGVALTLAVVGAALTWFNPEISPNRRPGDEESFRLMAGVGQWKTRTEPVEVWYYLNGRKNGPIVLDEPHWALTVVVERGTPIEVIAEQYEPGHLDCAIIKSGRQTDAVTHSRSNVGQVSCKYPRG